MVKLVIWDWNGTLLDDTATCFRIANIMRKERNMPPLENVEAYCRVFGFPVVDYYRAMGYTFETESYDDISREFVSLYVQHLSECRLQPDAETTLAKIRDLGVRQILLSATQRDKLAVQAEMFGVNGYFEQMLGLENDHAAGKAELARAFIGRAGLAPDEVLFVGDTDHDRAVSRAVGCRCVLLTCGHHLREKLLPLGVPLIDTLPELLAQL